MESSESEDELLLADEELLELLAAGSALFVLSLPRGMNSTSARISSTTSRITPAILAKPSGVEKKFWFPLFAVSFSRSVFTAPAAPPEASWLPCHQPQPPQVRQRLRG